MRIVAIINQKGGCGKTTTSINLAACLARLGKKTLLADMDPQGHCAVGLAVPEDQIECTMYDVLVDAADGRPVKLGQAVWQIATMFDLLPSTIKLAAFEQVFAGRPGREDRLVNALEGARGVYDWIILDCPPSVGLLTFNALRAADEVIVPVETGFFSLHGLTKMMETLEMLKDRCNRDILIRILPTLYDTRTKLAREVLSEMRQKFRDYLMESTINFNTKLKEAASFGQPITEYDPGSRGFKDFLTLARELLGHQVQQVQAAPLSRPAELVQRARQLAQMANFHFTPAVPSPVRTPSVTEGFTIPSGLELSMTAGPTVIEPFPRQVAPPPPPVAVVAKTTQQKIDEFYGVKQEGSELLFTTKFDNAQRIDIAGDFNDWTPGRNTMQSDPAGGPWRIRLPLPRGRYRYRLVVDGRWVTDPHNTQVEVNQFGELNNIAEVA